MPLSRRDFLKGAALAGSAVAAGSLASRLGRGQPGGGSNASHEHGGNAAVGLTSTQDFDPYAYLTRFDRGVVTPRPDGTSLREYEIRAHDVSLEVAPGVRFAAWGLNDGVPGPTIWAKEGDRLRIRFINAHTHPHTLHFHGIHAPEMDGIPGVGPGLIMPGQEFVYEFDAVPHGVHLYHCHTPPLKKHIAKGLYGAYVVEPKDGWGEPANEMVMVMNAFDTDFDGENEVYALNSKAFAYLHRPIVIKKGQLQRVFLVNLTEHDPINSFHLHSNFFHYTEIGHKSNPRRFTDNVALIQGERGMLEFKYDIPGRFMFHAHQSEFAELGWTSMFEVVE